MKTLLKVTAAAALILTSVLLSGPAFAQHRGHGHGHGGGVRFGVSVGFPAYPAAVFRPSYYVYPAPAYTYPAATYLYPANAYSYPAAAVPVSPPVYIERSASISASAPVPAQADWYYCAESGSYYPYVNDCPAGWQRVPAQPR